ncbi:hypothetical protein BDQ12DRAFT_691202 [Crucibulum laeve]|uniref:Uncharacterized protein n=1 Tax=Crucibulum laeve TaxID=68775 RepID=A0A5C3LM95_9AGAR|nr:hypothetical protein BDQ12DRAFT_691202 [Crucibulum laeve]
MRIGSLLITLSLASTAFVSALPAGYRSSIIFRVFNDSTNIYLRELADGPLNSRSEYEEVDLIAREIGRPLKWAKKFIPSRGRAKSSPLSTKIASKTPQSHHQASSSVNAGGLTAPVLNHALAKARNNQQHLKPGSKPKGKVATTIGKIKNKIRKEKGSKALPAHPPPEKLPVLDISRKFSDKVLPPTPGPASPVIPDDRIGIAL